MLPTNNVNVSVNNIQTVLVDSVTRLSSDEDIEEAKARAEWISIMGDTVLSRLHRTISGAESDKIIIIAGAIIKTELNIIGENLLFPQNVDDIGFYILYNDDNYITAMFSGMLGGAHVTHMHWPVMVDIKNKKRLILRDIVEINDLFVDAVFKEMEKIIREELGSNISNFYTKEEQKKDLLEANVLYKDKYEPSVASYFDTSKLVIYFENIAPRAVILPLCQIRTMIILPNFPTESE